MLLTSVAEQEKGIGRCNIKSDKCRMIYIHPTFCNDFCLKSNIVLIIDFNTVKEVINKCKDTTF